MFSIGDRVRLTKDIGGFLAMTEGIITNYNNSISYGFKVKFDGGSSTWAAANEIELIQAHLPIIYGGLNQWLPNNPSESFFYKIQMNMEDSIPVPIPATKCDCGGFKTYGTMDPASHSHWCSSQKTKNDQTLGE